MGTYGMVVAFVNKETNEYAAVKRIDRLFDQKTFY
jgi:hypothetical protein